MLQDIIEKVYCRYERENSHRHLEAFRLKMGSRLNLPMRVEGGMSKRGRKERRGQERSNGGLKENGPHRIIDSDTINRCGYTLLGAVFEVSDVQSHPVWMSFPSLCESEYTTFSYIFSTIYVAGLPASHHGNNKLKL